MIHFNPILAAAAANFFVGWLMFSKHVFGPMWSKAKGAATDMKKDFYIRLAAEVVSSLMTASALYLAILTFQKSQMMIPQELLTHVYSWFFKDIQAVQFDMMSSLKIAGFMLVGFIIPRHLSATVWGSTEIRWSKFMVCSISDIAQFAAMAIVITLLA